MFNFTMELRLLKDKLKIICKSGYLFFAPINYQEEGNERKIEGEAPLEER